MKTARTQPAATLATRTAWLAVPLLALLAIVRGCAIEPEPPERFPWQLRPFGERIESPPPRSDQREGKSHRWFWNEPARNRDELTHEVPGALET